MEISFDFLQSSTNEQLYNKLKDIMDKYLIDLDDLILEKTSFRNYMIRSINDIKRGITKENFNQDEIVKRTEKAIIKHIDSELGKDKIGLKSLINYFNKHIANKEEYDEILSAIKTFDEIINKYKLNINSGYISDLLKNEAICETLNNIVSNFDNIDLCIQMFSSKFIKDLINEFYLENIIEEEDLNSYDENIIIDGNLEDSVKIYLKEIGAIPLLSQDEEIEYGKKINETKELIKTLDKDADKKELEKLNKRLEKYYHEFSEHNLRLVVSIAKRYTNRGLDFLDLISEGNVGLLKAIEKYNVDTGNKFSTYATWWIRQAITRAIADQSRTVRYPVHYVEKINKFIKCKRNLTDRFGEEPTLQDIADELGISFKEVKELDMYAQSSVSLNAQLTTREDNGDEIIDFIKDDKINVEETVIQDDLHSYVFDVLCEKLTPREEEVVKLRCGFYDDKIYTLEEVGKRFNVTRERIRQIEAKAYRKLRRVDKLIMSMNSINDNDMIKKVSSKNETRVKENTVHPLKTIYQDYPNYKSYIIDLLPKYLNDSECDIFYKRYGYNLKVQNVTLWTGKESHDFYQIVKPKMEELLKTISKDVYNFLISDKSLEKIYNYYSKFSKSSIKKVLDDLDDDEVLLLKRYFNNLVTDDEKKRFESIGKIQFEEDLHNIGKNKNIKKSIYSILDNYTELEINRALIELPYEYRDLLFKKYGYDLTLPFKYANLSHDEERTFRKVILPEIINFIEKNKKRQIQDFELLKVFNRFLLSEDFKKYLLFKDCKNALIISLYLGYIDGKNYNQKSLCELFDMNLFDMNFILTEGLKNTQSILLQMKDSELKLIRRQYDTNNC